MITQNDLLNIGFVKTGDFFEKHELTSIYLLKLEKGIVTHIREGRGLTIIKYPINVDNIKDLILAYEIISGSIIYHEISNNYNKDYLILIPFIIALIALFVIYFTI